MSGILYRLALAAALIAANLAHAGPAEDLQAIMADYDRYLAKADPIDAGERGDIAAARLWPDDSPAAVADRAAALKSFHGRLQAIPPEALSGEDALNRALLTYRVDLDIDGERYDEERIPFTSDEGFYVTPGYVAQGTVLRTRADIDAYLTRLDHLPDYYDCEVNNMRRGLETGFVQPRITALTAAKATRAEADIPIDQHPMLAPFNHPPSGISAADAARMKAQAIDLIRTRVRPAEARLAIFFETEYLPRARDSIGASALPDGRAYYAYRARRETTTNLTPDEIFDLGQSEIARIRGEMERAIADSGFKGSFAAFQDYLRRDPQFYVATREALLEKASRIAKRIDDQLPSYFATLPRLSYGVREVPRAIEEGYTTGRYNPGSPSQGVAGGLMINTSHLDQRPLYELPALVAHEGAPGHHIQIALAQELTGVPQFRRESDLTAFVEGWALYAEQLGTEIGLYATPYERFGLLSMEMWRACRLVVDVGMHWKGWSRDQAVACLKDNTALSDKNIQNEVDRYIAWPGQALGYKVGELKILELRRRAQAALGSKFDYRTFHDAILDEGPLPMALLEARIDDWIKSRR
jgi:uncharacterized protein (DUF885 family)